MLGCTLAVFSPVLITMGCGSIQKLHCGSLLVLFLRVPWNEAPLMGSETSEGSPLKVGVSLATKFTG